MINECNIYVYYDFIIIHNRVIIPIFVCGTFGENLVLGLLEMAKKSVKRVWRGTKREMPLNSCFLSTTPTSLVLIRPSTVLFKNGVGVAQYNRKGPKIIYSFVLGFTCTWKCKWWSWTTWRSSWSHTFQPLDTFQQLWNWFSLSTTLATTECCKRSHFWETTSRSKKRQQDDNRTVDSRKRR